MRGSTSRTNLNFNTAPVQLRFTQDQWTDLLTELRTRGEGRKESGAFLLGLVPHPQGGVQDDTVRMIIYYDDLDAECLRGGIELSGSAFDTLWQICRDNRLTVIADIHTHPSGWIAQSDIDRRNPMIAQVGHIAIILPNFAQGPIDSATIGIYKYLGAHRWLTLNGECDRVLTFTPAHGSPIECTHQDVSSTVKRIFRRLRHSWSRRKKGAQQP